MFSLTGNYIPRLEQPKYEDGHPYSSSSEVKKSGIAFLFPLLDKPKLMGWDSSVGIGTRYGLRSPGIEPRWGRDFPLPSILCLEATQPPIHWVPSISRGGKAAGTWCSQPPPSSADVKENVEL